VEKCGVIICTVFGTPFSPPLHAFTAMHHPSTEVLPPHPTAAAAAYECLSRLVARWSQTANYGVLPSPAMPNSFLAQVYDLGDPWANMGDNRGGSDPNNCTLPPYGPKCAPWDPSEWAKGMQPYAPAIRENSPSGVPGVNFMGGIHPRLKRPVGARQVPPSPSHLTSRHLTPHLAPRHPHLAISNVYDAMQCKRHSMLRINISGKCSIRSKTMMRCFLTNSFGFVVVLFTHSCGVGFTHSGTCVWGVV